MQTTLMTVFAMFYLKCLFYIIWITEVEPQPWQQDDLNLWMFIPLVVSCSFNCLFITLLLGKYKNPNSCTIKIHISSIVIHFIFVIGNLCIITAVVLRTSTQRKKNTSVEQPHDPNSPQVA